MSKGEQANPAHEGPMWLLRGGEVLAAAEVAATHSARLRGLAGRRGYEGALCVPRARMAHTLGMRFALDVAFLDADLVVVDTVRVAPWRVTRPRLSCRWVVQAEAGAFERWRLRPGDQLELHSVS
ncbi:MAG TPA: DUF192 domain-containing protein [Acidimicrobiales bacterium]|nr:DUF192 domain-containing protein [Acidimicrobiales bacterium]